MLANDFPPTQRPFNCIPPPNGLWSLTEPRHTNGCPCPYHNITLPHHPILLACGVVSFGVSPFLRKHSLVFSPSPVITFCLISLSCSSDSSPTPFYMFCSPISLLYLFTPRSFDLLAYCAVKGYCRHCHNSFTRLRSNISPVGIPPWYSLSFLLS